MTVQDNSYQIQDVATIFIDEAHLFNLLGKFCFLKIPVK